MLTITVHPAKELRKRARFDLLQHENPRELSSTNLVASFVDELRIPIEVDNLIPDHLKSLTYQEIEELPILWGNQIISLKSIATIYGDATDGKVIFAGETDCLKRIGAKMTEGCIEVHGNAGWHLGREMRGGEIKVFGDVGDYCGGEMAGGKIIVLGNAGNHVGGAFPGSPKGIRGGFIYIQKNAGHEIATQMRRGWIIVGGNCGDFCGAGMIAGSLWIFGKTGMGTGTGMKRGTIVASDCTELPPTFCQSTRDLPRFLQFYFHSLREENIEFPAIWGKRLFQLYRGDLLEKGLGEIWIPCP